MDLHEVSVRIAFYIRGYQAGGDRRNICMHPGADRKRAASIVCIPSRCGTCRACVTACGRALAKAAGRLAPAVAVTQRGERTGATPGGRCIPTHTMSAEPPDG